MKKGKLALDYVAIILLALIVLVVMLIFSGKLREKSIDAWQSFLSTIGFR